MEAYRNSSRTTYLHSRQSYDAETVDTNHTNLDDDDDDDVDSTNYTYLDRNRNPRDSQSRSKKHTSTSSSPSDNDNNNPSGELLTSCTGTINTRSTRIYDNITCPPSLVEQIRQSQQSQNGPIEGPGGTAGTAGGCATSDSISSINVVLPETTTNCIANNFDIVKHSENIQNYKSIAYNFANPCSTIINDYLPGAEGLGRKSEYVMHKEQQQHNDHHQQQHQQQHHQQQPMTPSTVGSSYSDENENDDDDDDESQDNLSLIHI